MNFNLRKEKLEEIIKDYIINNIYEYKSNIFNYDKVYINNFIDEYINNIKFNEIDYENIKNSITNDIMIKKYFLESKDLENIISIVSNTINNYTLECSTIDNESLLYFHLQNNQSYLINYDSIEEKWYLALIETDSLNLIKEIYSDSYYNFINYLKNNLKTAK